jgi:starch synthase (maltosyl-transferring)
VGQIHELVTVRLGDIELAFSREDGGLRALSRIGGPNVLGYGAPRPSIDIQVAASVWLAERSFVRYLSHRVYGEGGAQLLEIVIGFGPLILYDRFTVTGTLVVRTVRVQNVGDDPIRLHGIRLLLPWARVGAAESCRFEAPGASVRPHVRYSVATEQRLDILPRRFFAPGLRDEGRAIEAAPIFTPGLMALHNPELEESLLCWYDGGPEPAFAQLEGNDQAATLQHEVGLAGWLSSEESLTTGQQYMLLMHEAWSGGVAAFRRTWLLRMGRQLANPPAWVHNAAIYETHPALFGGFAGLAEALPKLKLLGVDTICLLPIWPHGSSQPYLWDGAWDAQSDPYALRELETFDPTLGTAEAFQRLVDAIHGCGLRVLLDLPLLGCAPNSPMIYEHPTWFCRDSAGQLIRLPGRDGIIAFDWAQPELHAAMYQRWIALFQAHPIDGFRLIVPRSVLSNWSGERPKRVSAGQTGYIPLADRLRATITTMRPDSVIIGDMAGPIGQTIQDAAIDELAHHMFVHMALGRLTPAELGEWLEDHWAALPADHPRICFTESHRTWLINPLADGLRGSRISRMLLVGIVLAGFVPSIWSGEEGDEWQTIENLLYLRRTWPVLRTGSMSCSSIPCNNAQVFTILRREGSKHAVGLLNVGPHRQPVTISMPIDTLDLCDCDYRLHELISGEHWEEQAQSTWRRDELLALSLTLQPFGAYCFVIEPTTS